MSRRPSAADLPAHPPYAMWHRGGGATAGLARLSTWARGRTRGPDWRRSASRYRTRADQKMQCGTQNLDKSVPLLSYSAHERKRVQDLGARERCRGPFARHERCRASLLLAMDAPRASASACARTLPAGLPCTPSRLHNRLRLTCTHSESQPFPHYPPPGIHRRTTLPHFVAEKSSERARRWVRSWLKFGEVKCIAPLRRQASRARSHSPHTTSATA